MMISFLRRAMLACLLCVAIVFQGCALPAWVGQVGTIVVALAPSVINVLQIVALAEGKPYNEALASKITADAASIKVLATDFATASAAAAPQACQQLQAALQTFQADENTVLTLVNVVDPVTQQKAVVLMGLVTGAFQGVVALIPSCQAPVALRESLMRANVTVNGNRFVSSYNQALVIPTGKAAVDSYTKGHKIHAHSAFVRFISFGREK